MNSMVGQVQSACSTGLSSQLVHSYRPINDKRSSECRFGVDSIDKKIHSLETCSHRALHPGPFTDPLSPLVNLDPSSNEVKWSFHFAQASALSPLRRRRGKRGGRNRRLKHLVQDKGELLTGKSSCRSSKTSLSLTLGGGQSSNHPALGDLKPEPMPAKKATQKPPDQRALLSTTRTLSKSVLELKPFVRNQRVGSPQSRAKRGKAVSSPLSVLLTARNPMRSLPALYQKSILAKLSGNSPGPLATHSHTIGQQSQVQSSMGTCGAKSVSGHPSGLRNSRPPAPGSKPLPLLIRDQTSKDPMMQFVAHTTILTPEGPKTAETSSFPGSLKPCYLPERLSWPLLVSSDFSLPTKEQVDMVQCWKPDTQSFPLIDGRSRRPASSASFDLLHKWGDSKKRLPGSWPLYSANMPVPLTCPRLLVGDSYQDVSTCSPTNRSDKLSNISRDHCEPLHASQSSRVQQKLHDFLKHGHANRCWCSYHCQAKDTLVLNVQIRHVHSNSDVAVSKTTKDTESPSDDEERSLTEDGNRFKLLDNPSALSSPLATCCAEKLSDDIPPPATSGRIHSVESVYCDTHIDNLHDVGVPHHNKSYGKGDHDRIDVSLSESCSTLDLFNFPRVSKSDTTSPASSLIKTQPATLSIESISSVADGSCGSSGNQATTFSISLSSPIGNSHEESSPWILLPRKTPTDDKEWQEFCTVWPPLTPLELKDALWDDMESCEACHEILCTCACLNNKLKADTSDKI